VRKRKSDDHAEFRGVFSVEFRVFSATNQKFYFQGTLFGIEVDFMSLKVFRFIRGLLE
jgi:hypothetical protein